MMKHKHRLFSTGDRVRTCETIRGIPVGTLGSIMRVYHSMPGTYDVQFDGRAELHTIWGGHLELAIERAQAISS